MTKQELTWLDVEMMAVELHNRLQGISRPKGRPLNVYGIPRGGVYAAQSLLWAAAEGMMGSPSYRLVTDPMEADIFVDDLIDSGTTQKLYNQQYPDCEVYALMTKKPGDPWVVFPWERMLNELGVEHNIERILEYIGEDPKREGLQDTPKRVAKSYAEIFSGYKKDPADVMKVFEDGACDEMVVLRDIEFYSVCEHHMQPFFGKAHIAYIPDGRVIGISKLARVLEIYSRRLQIQERLTQQITTALMEGLLPKGAACVLEAQHFCMVCRGVNKQNSKMVTSSLQGVFKEPTPRAEFFSLIRQ